MGVSEAITCRPLLCTDVSIPSGFIISQTHPHMYQHFHPWVVPVGHLSGKEG